MAMYPTSMDTGLRCFHVAFLVKGGKIVRVGWNKNKTVPVTNHHPYHTGLIGKHAELDVIYKQQSDWLDSYELVVIRINRNLEFAMSKPCAGCRSFIKQFGLSAVWYSDSTPTGNLVKM